MKDDSNISVIIIYSFAFLFIVFLFLQEGKIINQPSTGYALFSLDNLGDSSLIAIIIITIILIVIAGTGFFVYKKLKSKKSLLEIPKPPQPAEKSLTDLSKEFNLPESIPEPKKQEINMDGDLSQLFAESKSPVIQKHPAQEIPKEDLKEKEANLDELKKLISSLMKKNYTKESIINYLNKKGFKLVYIKKAIDMINEDNLSNYVQNALSQGFSRDEIAKSLLEHGWNKEEIAKYI